jgi:hypothetical protein
MQKMLHNLQIKLEVYHLDNSEYPRGTFYSYTNPEEGPWQREHSLVALAELLDVDPNDLYPCSKYDQQCETRFTYQSPDSNSLLDNCWKNHYTLEYSIQNPTTPFQPRQQFPCGPVSGSFGNDEIPSYCDESNLDVWDEWLCNILRDQAGQEFYLYIN